MNLKIKVFGWFGKVITVSFVMALIQFFYTREYLMKSTKTEPHPQHLNITKTVEIKKIKRVDLEELVKAVESASDVDPSGTYVVVPNIAVPDVPGTNETEVVTLCTQTATNHLHYVTDLAKYWRKPISVTLFTHGKEAVLSLYTIAYLRRCFKDVESTVMFHLAYPKETPPLMLNSIYSMDLVCNNLDKLRSNNMKLNYDHAIPYPHNTLRNIAIKHAMTPYVLVADIDLVPSDNLAGGFAEFVRRYSRINSHSLDDDKIAYIVPTVESSTDKHIPNKGTLSKEWNAGRVRRFYSSMCKKCHLTTNYDRWLRLRWLPYMDVGYMVVWSFAWEPFYIAKKNGLPGYDSRFKQYGYDRISHTCELFMAGYMFAVLNNGFLVHRGFKVPDVFHAQKDRENTRNARLYDIFKEDLKKRYPRSYRTC